MQLVLIDRDEREGLQGLSQSWNPKWHFYDRAKRSSTHNSKINKWKKPESEHRFELSRALAGQCGNYCMVRWYSHACQQRKRGKSMQSLGEIDRFPQRHCRETKFHVAFTCRLCRDWNFPLTHTFTDIHQRQSWKKAASNLSHFLLHSLAHSHLSTF